MSIAYQPPRSQAPAPAARGWSPVDLLRKVDNDIDLATELVQIFLEDVAEMSDDICSAARSGDAARLASAAHAYKGSAAAIGADAVASAACSLEQEGRAGNCDVEIELAYFLEIESRLIEELSAATTVC